MERTPLDFIVLGLPRSGTTWMANWLTTDRSLCLHDPFGTGMPHTWPVDHRPRGISCTVAGMLPDWLKTYRCPIAVVVRDVQECDRSLRRLGLPDAALCHQFLSDAPGRRFPFEALWKEESARTLWEYLLPVVPFDALRWKLLKDMQVQPYWPNWSVDAETMRHISREVSRVRRR